LSFSSSFYFPSILADAFMHGFYIKGYEMIILIGKIAKFDSKIVQNFEFYSKSDTEQKKHMP